MKKLSAILLAGVFVIGSSVAYAQGGGGAGAGSGPAGQSSGGKSDTAKDTIKSSKIGKGGVKHSRRHRRHHY